jgi:hypothetical protein
VVDQANAPAPDRAPARPARGRRELFAFLELAALCGLAVAQPLLDVIGRSPDFLVFHGAGPAQAVALATIVALGPPMALWAVAAATRRAGERTRRLTQAALVGALSAVFAVEAGKQATPLRGVPLAALAALAGVAVGLGYARLAVFGQVLRVAAAGPLVFVLLFVFASPAAGVVLGDRDGAGPAGTEVGPHPPIVVIVLDELPLVSLLDTTGAVDAARVPHFARLAAGSTWYRNATAVSPHTTYAVPSMLTGRFPTGVQAPHYSRYPRNLFTLLGEEYDIRAWESVTRLCPPRLCPDRPGARGGLPAMLNESAALLGKVASPYDSAEDPTAGFREATAGEAGGYRASTDVDFRMGGLGENQPARFADFLATLPAAPTAAPTAPPTAPPTGSPTGSRPVLRFLHLLIPHSPWLYLSSGTRYDGPGDLPFDGRWWARLAHQRHLQQVRYADRLLGEAMAALEHAGVYDESLVVVTSDHGDSFSEGVSGRDMDPGQRAAAELAWVPLFVKEPGQRSGRVDDRNWQHVDLLPTLAGYAGLAVPWRTDGISVARQRRAGADKSFHQRPGKPWTVRTGEHFPAVLRGPAARPVLTDVPELSLVGRPLAGLPVSSGGPPAEVANRAEFADVRPGRHRIPALVDARVPASVPEGTPVAVGLNGRIAAVALAVADKAGDRRVVGLVTDETMFVPGANRLELFTIAGRPGDWRLTRLSGP